MSGWGARPTRSSTVGMRSTVETCAPAAAPVAPGGAHDERDVLGGVVDEEGVRVLPVLPEALPVVGEEHEDRAVPDARALEPRDEAPHHLVGVGHLAEVPLAPVAREERLRRLVGRVGVVEVDPGEELLRLHALQPLEREVHHLVALLLDGAEVHDLVLREVEAVGVVVEALVEAPPRVEHPGADEGAGRVAARLHPLGERRRLLLDEEAAVVADAVLRGDEPGEDRRVRGKRQRHRGRGLLEEDALGGDRVDVRGVDAPEAVAAQSVGAQRVERDDDDVEVGGSGPARREPAAGVRVGLRRARAQDEEAPPPPAREGPPPPATAGGGRVSRS